MAPDDFARGVDGAATKDAGGIHFDDVGSSEGRHMGVGKENVGALIVTLGKLAGEGLGLAGVRRLVRTEPLLAGDAVVQKERSAIGDFDLTEPADRSRCRRAWHADFKVAHQFRIDGHSIFKA